MKAKKLNKDVFQQSFKIFVDYFIGAWLISGFGLTGICVFRHVFRNKLKVDYEFIILFTTFALETSLDEFIIPLCWLFPQLWVAFCAHFCWLNVSSIRTRMDSQRL